MVQIAHNSGPVDPGTAPERAGAKTQPGRSTLPDRVTRARLPREQCGLGLKLYPFMGGVLLLLAATVTPRRLPPGGTVGTRCVAQTHPAMPRRQFRCTSLEDLWCDADIRTEPLTVSITLLHLPST